MDGAKFSPQLTSHTLYCKQRAINYTTIFFVVVVCFILKPLIYIELSKNLNKTILLASCAITTNMLDLDFTFTI
jgi:hypothetical protein